jgi:hypothetical protein
MRCLASQLSGRRPTELDSEETYDFLARKSIAGKGLSNPDDRGAVHHHSVVSRRVSKHV